MTRSLYLVWALAVGLGRSSKHILDGLKCSSESVYQANSAQLHSILSELADSTFFRLVRVSYDGSCPLTPAQDSDGPTCGTVPPAEPVRELTSQSSSPEPSLCSVDFSSSAKEFASSVVTQISSSEQSAQKEFPRDNECVLEGTFSIRPDYWLDICEGFSVGEYVNLRLNPERNTGYNGAHVWAEMHATVDKLHSPEGKILQRILSGYHMLVTTQVLSNYYPPKNGESAWAPNFSKLTNLVQSNPQYVEDMQFAFVVMARSLFKIRELLYGYHFSTGNAAEDEVTASLVQHLLDSAVLSSCGSVVLSGFDESELFPTASPSLSESATEFKKAFRKISQLVNCVSCKRCKLHASVALHGIGVGIKILLSPTDLVAASLSRDDIVALVNVVHKFSDSLELVRARDTIEHDPLDIRAKAMNEILRLQSNLTKIEKDALVHAVMKNDENVMFLAKSLIGTNMSFVRHSLISLGLNTPDAVVIGGGLAGLVTAISIAERGGSVVVVEKQTTLGGNSAKASSGINSLRTNSSEEIDQFLSDTVKSQNGHGVEKLAQLLVKNSNQSVAWLEQVSGVSLSSLGQLGGHKSARTWKPEHGVVGAELMAALIRVSKSMFPKIQIVTGAKVTELIAEEKKIQGVKLVHANGETGTIYARSVVLASGGFGFDTEGLVRAYRPDLVGFPTTLGSQTTGDGIKLATSVGADLLDMEYVQLHPTGFIDPNDPGNRVKVLAAEVLRGIGGILLDKEGKRFVNELGTRKHVTDVMLQNCQGSDCAFWLVIDETSAGKADNLIRIYENRGLLKRVNSGELENIVGKNYVPESHGNFFIGRVTPVIHYTMGGVRIDELGRVLKSDGSPIQGLFAVGEVTGGVHGENRLGGNSLLECTVYGRIIGGFSIDIVEELSPSQFSSFGNGVSSSKTDREARTVKTMKLADVAVHNTVEDCWTVIDNHVYNLSRYADEHPGGVGAIKDSCGTDSTKRFLVAHTLGLLNDVGFEPIGIINFSQPSV